MARDLTANFITEITAENNRPIFLAELTFASSVIRLWTGIGDLTWDSKTWFGNGWLHGLTGMAETREVEAVGMEVELAGVPAAVLSAVLNESNQGKAGNIYLGFLNSSGAVIADPYLVFEGRMDVPTIYEDPLEPRVTIAYESRLIDLERAKEFSYTTETQQQFSYGANDKGFEFNSQAVEWTGFWGNQQKKPKKKKKRRRRRR